MGTIDARWLQDRPIAHRGLHDARRSIFENSVSAFRAAIDAGYAIECDVHLSRDRVPVVFHDEMLARMTGVEGRVRDADAEALVRLPLRGTRDTIPSLRDLLDLVAGQVPLVIELKGLLADLDDGFVEIVAEAIRGYRGKLALMSFDEWLIEQAATVSPGVPFGLTAEGTRADVLERHRVVFAGHCSFVSYNVHHLPNTFVDWVRDERHLPVISWTVRTPADVERSHRHADQMTFEGFVPS